jgi:hypothetical protein
MERQELIFPIMIIALDVGAAFGYALECDWRRVIYWLAAATLTACVTFTGEDFTGGAA